MLANTGATAQVLILLYSVTKQELHILLRLRKKGFVVFFFCHYID